MGKVAVIGMGKSGESAAKLLRKQGHQVTCFDQKSGGTILSDREPYNFEGFEFAVLSPGVPPSNVLVRLLERDGIEILSEIELALRSMKNRTVIAITGTNGKTTVTQMIAHSLNFLGIKAHAVGNIGRPLSDALDEEGVFVVELSSFQLERTFTPGFDVAVLLRITPDHMDRYPTFVDYAEAKVRIASLIKPEGLLVVHQDTTKMFPHLPEGKRIGWRDAENEQAAIYTLSHFGKTALEVKKALATFRTAPHRIEWIKEVNGVNFYNDSKATNVDSVLFALKSMKGPIHLIAGGKHKGSPVARRGAPFLRRRLKKST